ncbi:hypothetical protein KEM56_000085 [Ascosphaera pollenicola]|nr:hypothetical protein KEM56_000085 [Ascosphaera pollenicola]
MPLFNFLGHVSFPVYLLHDTVIRTVLVWMVYGPSASQLPETDAEATYLIAYMWNWYVDPKCAKVVDWLKNLMFENENDVQTVEKPAPLVAVTVHDGK